MNPKLKQAYQTIESFADSALEWVKDSPYSVAVLLMFVGFIVWMVW